MNFPKNPLRELRVHQILLSNQIEQLTRLNIWVNRLSEYLGFSQNLRFRLDLILSETITNIIENAYPDNQTHPIKVELQYCNNKLTLSVEDDGIPFNPCEREEFEFPENLEDASIGGLGIHLICSYSDELSYQRKDNKNQIRIVIYDPQK
jgi:anti-sigma regulatory factor (Ser/Thr protein kinase)